MDDTERAGHRIAAARKSAGMTQQELADMAKVSRSMLAKVESGHATASNAWIGSVAKVLAVDVGYLTGQPYTSATPSQAAVHRLIPSVRRALATWDLLPGIEELSAPTLDYLAEEVHQLAEWRRQTAYEQLGLHLPEVMARLSMATRQPASDHDRERAFALLTQTYRAANSMVYKLGYTDLSLTALDRMDWAASHSGDPLLVAIVHYVRARTLAKIGEHTGAINLITRAIKLVEESGGSGPQARGVLGCLHMKLIALYGSRADGDMVATHVAEANRIAVDTGPDHVVYQTVFGPANIKLHELSAKVDMGRPGEALDVAATTVIPDGMAKERATYFYIDLARAHLLNSEPDKAIDALYEARTIAPVHFVNSSVVRNTIHSIATDQRRSTRGLRALATSVGIPD